MRGVVLFAGGVMAAASTTLVACESAGPADVGIDVAALDAMSEVAADAYAGLDGGREDTAHLTDAADDVMGEVATDAAVFDCGSCRAPSACEARTCESSCEYVTMADGESCGASEYCVDGVCQAPRCGDGIRTSDEACDDGDVESGDGCSSSCEAEVVEVARQVSVRARALGATTWNLPTVEEPGSAGMGASGVDDEGNLVVTWARDVATTSVPEYELVLRRYDRTLSPIDVDPIVLGRANLREADCPGVVPLRSGWLVVWRGMSGTAGVRYVVVPAAGAVPAVRDVAVERARNVGAVRLATGFVVTWQAGIIGSTVRARLFDASGAPRAAAFNLAPAAKPGESLLVGVGRGADSRWTAFWVDGFGDGVTRREYDGATALGSPTVFPAPPLMYYVGASVDDWLIVGGVEMVARGTVRIAALEDGVSHADTSNWVSEGTSGPDELLTLTALGGGEWFAIWRGASGLSLATSDGTPPPRGWETLRDDAPADVTSLSVGRGGPRAEDGWIFTYIAPGAGGVPDRLRTLRLMPPTRGD